MKRTAQIVAAVASLLCAPGLALAQDAITQPAQKTVGAHTPKMVPSLAVLNSGGAKLAGAKLTMTGIAPNSIVFADRPVRAAGHVLTSDFIKQWDEGSDSFASDPPNATISVMSGDGSAIEDAVVILKKPKLEGDSLTFDVAVLEGNLSGANGRPPYSSTGSPRAAALATSAPSAVSAGTRRSGMAAGTAIPVPTTARDWPRERSSAPRRLQPTGRTIRLPHAAITLTRLATRRFGRFAWQRLSSPLARSASMEANRENAAKKLV